MSHIEKELERIRERLVNHPPPMEYGPLYAAQQALEWVRDPDGSAPPFAMITGIREERTGCCPTDRPGLSEGISA